MIKKTEILAFCIIGMLIVMPVTTMLANAQAYGGTLIVALPAEPKRLNTNAFYDIGAARIISNVYKRLVTSDDSGLTVVPDLAKSWEVSPDAKTYTFHLFENVTWHDGTKFTSADVKFTYEDLVRLKGNLWASYDGITLETPDEYTVIFKLPKPNSAFLWTLAGNVVSFTVILPKHLFEGTNWTSENPYNDKPIGTGPFKFVEWVRGDHLIFEANEEYFRGRPYADTLIARIITSRATALLALEKGEVHFYGTGVSKKDILPIAGKQGIGFYHYDFPNVIHLGLNMQKAPYDDKRVRWAIAHAVNTTEVNELAFLGSLNLATSVFASTQPYYDPTIKLAEYDPVKAEQLLDEAGYPRGADGVRFRASVMSGMGMGGPDIGASLKEQLAKVGIEVYQEIVDTATWPARGAKGEFDIYVAGGGPGPEVDQWRVFLHSNGFRNWPRYNDSRVDELFDLAVSATDEEDRAAYYKELQLLVLEAMPRINLVEWAYIYTYRADMWANFWCKPDVRLPYNSFESAYSLNITPITPRARLSTLEIALIVGVGIVAVVVPIGLYIYSRKRK